MLLTIPPSMLAVNSCPCTSHPPGTPPAPAGDPTTAPAVSSDAPYAPGSRMYDMQRNSGCPAAVRPGSCQIVGGAILSPDHPEGTEPVPASAFLPRPPGERSVGLHGRMTPSGVHARIPQSLHKLRSAVHGRGWARGFEKCTNRAGARLRRIQDLPKCKGGRTIDRMAPLVSQLPSGSECFASPQPTDHPHTHLAQEDGLGDGVLLISWEDFVCGGRRRDSLWCLANQVGLLEQPSYFVHPLHHFHQWVS